jgi:hypothetical protein
MPKLPYPNFRPLKPAVEQTSYVPGVKYILKERIPEGRNQGCTIIRRYPDGSLAISYVVNKIMEIINKVEAGGKLNASEMALVSVILPHRYGHLVDPIIASGQLKMSDEEKILVTLKVIAELKEAANWNTGFGGSSVPGRSVTKQ